MDRSEAYHRKMSEGKVSLLIIKLGLPTTVAMLITNIYNLVDTYFVGTLGTSQQGATGILFTLQAIIQAFAFLLGHGAGVYITKYLAEKRNEKAATYCSTAFFVGFAIGLLLLLFGLIFLEPFMLLLGSSDTILPYAKEYGLWVLISAPFLIASLILNNTLRYESKAFFAMIGLVTGALLNILGDFIFINLCGLGVFGAGMSTGISQIVSFGLLLFFHLWKSQARVSFKKISKEGDVYWKIASAGFPSMVRQGLSSISGGVLNNLAKPFGDAAIAAISVVNRYSNFVMCVGLGVGQGFQPVSAYCYATKQYDRLKRGAFFTLGFTLCVIAIFCTLTLIFPAPIITWFNKDEEVIRLGVYALNWTAWTLLACPFFIISNMTFQAVRKSLMATLLALLRNGVVFIPMIFILVHGFGLGYEGVAMSQPISDLITAAISFPCVLVFLLRLPKVTAPKAEEAKND